MGFQKISALSLTDLFVQQIENMILSGELQPGDQLPPARELAAKLDVSRPVVTAGLIELEKLGFVEVRQRVGAFVCDYRRKGSVETLVAIMRYNGGALGKPEIKSLMEIRTPLESLCVRLVLANASDDEIASLSCRLEAIQTAVSKSAEETAEATFAFHHELAVLSGNMLLPLLYHSFKVGAVYLWTLYARNHGVSRLYRNKLKLYQALLNRDLETALALTPGEYPRNSEEYRWPV